METIIVVSLIISVVAVTIAALSLYFNSLKNVNLDTRIEIKTKDIEEDKKNDKEDKKEKEIPDGLSFDIYVCVFNNGNSPGIVRSIKMQFLPKDRLKKYVSKFEFSGFPEYIEVPAKGTGYKSGIGRVLLKNISRDIRELLNEDIENDTLLPLLDTMKRKKREDLKEFLNFLKKNKKLGDMKTTWEQTYSPWKIFSIKFKSKTETKSVTHSYKNLLEVCDYWVRNFEFKPPKDKEVNSIIGNLKDLKGFYIRSLNEYRSHKNCLMDANFELRNGRFQNTLTLLKKCRKYKNAVKIIGKPYEVVRAFLDYMKKYKGTYPKDTEQKVEEAGAMLKDFEKETQEAIENIDSLIELIKGEDIQ